MAGIGAGAFTLITSFTAAKSAFKSTGLLSEGEKMGMFRAFGECLLPKNWYMGLKSKVVPILDSLQNKTFISNIKTNFRNKITNLDAKPESTGPKVTETPESAGTETISAENSKNKLTLGANKGNCTKIIQTGIRETYSVEYQNGKIIKITHIKNLFGRDVCDAITKESDPAKFKELCAEFKSKSTIILETKQNGAGNSTTTITQTKPHIPTEVIREEEFPSGNKILIHKENPVTRNKIDYTIINKKDGTYTRFVYDSTELKSTNYHYKANGKLKFVDMYELDPNIRITKRSFYCKKDGTPKIRNERSKK